MWILKGTFLGLWLLGFGTIALLYFSLYRNLPFNSAVSVSVFLAYTIHNPFWWTTLVTCLVLGFAITRAWTVPLGVWIALAVTGLIPAGFLALGAKGVK